MLVPVVFAAALSIGTSCALPHIAQVPIVVADDPYTLPLGSDDTLDRAKNIEWTRDNFRYGPDIAGHGPYYPVGPLADEMIESMNTSFFSEQIPWNGEVAADAAKVFQSFEQVKYFLLHLSSSD